MQPDVEPAGAKHEVVAPRRVGEQGLTRRQASGPEWRRSSRGLYVPSYVEQTPAQRVVEAAALVSADAAVTGWAALAWRGAQWFDGRAGGGRTVVPVPIVSATCSVRAQPLVTVVKERHGAHGRECVDGVWVAGVVRAVAHAVRHAAHARAAVVAVDMAAFNDLCSPDELRSHLLTTPRAPGVHAALEALRRADENAWSPMEVWMRTAWPVTVPDPGLLTNRPLFDLDGNHLLTPDLVDPVAGVLGEYDGSQHLGAKARRRDLERHELVRAHGLEQVVMMSDDLRDAAAFRGRVHDAYARAARRTASERTWTLELPSWWVPTFTVEQRRALDPAQRQRWLRHRDLTQAAPGAAPRSTATPPARRPER